MWAYLQNKLKVDFLYFFKFHPQESLESEQCSIYRSLVVNTSKEMMCFSDFPMPADYPNFPHNSELLQYFRLYADNFDLLRYIRFQVNLHLLRFSVFSPIIQTKLLICVRMSVCLFVLVCVCVWTSHVSDQSNKCHTEVRFLLLRSVGHCDR